MDQDSVQMASVAGVRYGFLTINCESAAGVQRGGGNLTGGPGVKSMLNAQWQAPRAVRAKELLDSIPGDDADAATRRAMAMLQFNVANPARQRTHEPMEFEDREASLRLF